MANVTTNLQLSIDGDGICEICKIIAPSVETLVCSSCTCRWHVPCLNSPPKDLKNLEAWTCPDCCFDVVAPPAVLSKGINIVEAIKAIEADTSLTEKEKSKKKQQLHTGKVSDEDELEEERANAMDNDAYKAIGEKLKCSFCMQMPERPVTTPCGHNFCLKCFQKWIGQGKNTCAKCRQLIPKKMSDNPRINSQLVEAIRKAKMARSNRPVGPAKAHHYVYNQDRPDEAFTTERAKKTGKANACSGKIFVTVAPDHFGPILAENDPVRGRGLQVGDSWEDRLSCRQWGAHLPHVAGIAGQSTYGAQSVALSGGYKDDEDHGEWFLYTGSGGRDLSGNKRTNKDQAFDQKFEKMNEALRLSCKKGYPVRVVRSHKEKRSAYAPEEGVRYDGVYRIEKCWRKVGIQGFKVCRYLFVRCDNEPAPWTSDEHGDRPRSLPSISELKKATDITERKESPSWDFEEKEGVWKWKKPAPLSRKGLAKNTGNPEETKRLRKAYKSSVQKSLLKEFSCQICRQVMSQPMTTPCGHNFCKLCLDAAFAGKTYVRERSKGGRTLRAQKNVLKCPACPVDISEYLQNAQVNRELMGVIESLKLQQQENEKEDSNGNSGDDEDAVEENLQKDSGDDEDAEEESLENDSDDDEDQDAAEENPEEDCGDNEDELKENPVNDSSSNETCLGKMTSADPEILAEGKTKGASKRLKRVAVSSKSNEIDEGKMDNADPNILVPGKTKRTSKRLKSPAASSSSNESDEGKLDNADPEILVPGKTKRASKRLKSAAVSSSSNETDEGKMENADSKTLAVSKAKRSSKSPKRAALSSLSNETGEEKMENADSKILAVGETKRASKRPKRAAQSPPSSETGEGNMENADSKIIAGGDAKRASKKGKQEAKTCSCRNQAS